MSTETGRLGLADRGKSRHRHVTQAEKGKLRQVEEGQYRQGGKGSRKAEAGRQWQIERVR
jgi:hypothetical protein